MNTQELFDAFRAVDPAWLKEADLLADHAAEQVSGNGTHAEPDNEIQQIFAQYSDRETKKAGRRIAEYNTEPKAVDYTNLLGISARKPAEGNAAASGIPVERNAVPSVPAERGSGNRIFRVLGGIAAAAALVSIGAFAGSVLSERNGGMTVPPAAQVSSPQQTNELVVVQENSADEAGFGAENTGIEYIVAERSSVTRYDVFYQDLSMIEQRVVMTDGAPYVMSSTYKVPDIYQPEGTPVELTLSPASEESLIPGCQYSVVVQQNEEVLDITDPETGENFKTYKFTSTDDINESTHTISITPDYLEEGSLVKVFVIIRDPNYEYSNNDSCAFRLYPAEPGAPCTYSINPAANTVLFASSE